MLTFASVPAIVNTISTLTRAPDVLGEVRRALCAGVEPGQNVHLETTKSESFRDDSLPRAISKAPFMKRGRLEYDVRAVTHPSAPGELDVQETARRACEEKSKCAAQALLASLDQHPARKATLFRIRCLSVASPVSARHQMKSRRCAFDRPCIVCMFLNGRARLTFCRRCVLSCLAGLPSLPTSAVAACVVLRLGGRTSCADARETTTPHAIVATAVTPAETKC